MALIFCDSFDHYTVGTQAQRKGWNDNVFGAVPGRNGTNGIAMNNDWTYVTLPAGDSFVMGCAVYFIGGGLGAPVFMFQDGNSAQCELKLDTSDKSLFVSRNGAEVGTSGPNAYQISGFQYIEWKVVIGNTGSTEVRVDGVVVLTLPNVDIQETGNAQATRAYLRGPGTTRFDDFYVATGGTYFGDVRVKAIFPDAAGNYSQFTPSAGSNYQCVDETPPNDDTDYVSSATAGHKDTYGFGAVGISGAVKGIQVLGLVRKDDAGSRTIRRIARIGGTDYNGSNIVVNDAYTYGIRDVLENNPATGLPWAVSEIDGAEFGIELVS